MHTISGSHIAGLGTVTGYGWGTQALWAGLTSSKPAATLQPSFGASTDDPGWIVRVPEGGRAEDGTTRFARAMRAAAREAINDALSRGWTPGARVGLIHACVLGDLDMYPMVTPGSGGFTGRQYLSVTPSTPVSLLMSEYGFHGPTMNLSAMCTSGSAAMITAKLWLDSDMADDVLVVSTDLSATPEVVRMFVQLGVAITDTDPLNACRPFQEGSRGFTFGEAAVATLMTSQRGTDAYASILGGAMSHDAYHVTSVDPELTHVRRCVEEALQAARVAGSDIEYMNAHGPGTRQCDAAEGQIAQTVVPEAQLYAVKPLVGHCQAAAGAAELAAALLGYEHGEIAASPHIAQPSVDQLIDGRTPMSGTHGLTLKTSLGMGGHNAALVLAPA
ncbi:beta-ketoacyl synthase N-terminal-like domain-containing protein [Gordonia sp. N1V]|uniref:beta-ketoacyl synthase N-terminal-like domain-containing protein n=1 Tax=Gordonia sp. N1V TaxID=3034163 RepID=UPI0023E2A600|nr:beta-ketoacyl synthase N-terminal-like domain-containing protein [Gordonia sp. N1V]MDF3285043.1 beta-ketoacyl synthase N-terminal-like domain-containing protein [Gordonia sp. N1V]